MRVAVLMGLLVLAVPLTVLGLTMRPEPSPWPKAAQPATVPMAPVRWGAADRESLSRLREVTLAQTRLALGELEACETRAARRSGTARNRAYRRCATRPLSFTNGFGAGNARMLSNLAATAGATQACRGRVLRLSGASADLAFAAETTLRDGLDLPWAELLKASRAIRATARETRGLARRPGWDRICRPRPPAREPAAQTTA